MSTARQHAEWLSLVSISGAFLSLPVLGRIFPHGLEAHDADLSAKLRLNFAEWQANAEAARPNPAINREFCEWVLRDVLEFEPRVLLEKTDIPQTVREAATDFAVDFAVAKTADQPRLLVKILPVGAELDKPLADGEKQTALSPVALMQNLLAAARVRLGLVTNGKQWTLVYAAANGATSAITWEAELWLEEKLTLRAFRSLLSQYRFFAVADQDTLESLLEESKQHQQELTDQLGAQVRQAIEVLMRSFEQMNPESGQNLLEDLTETEIYAAATTVMMRLVVLLRVEDAEEDLFGVKSSEVYQKNYAVAPLREQLQAVADYNGEELLERQYDAWCRLLAVFRAVFAGANHPAFQLLPHGGDLFDPDRFSFLEGRKTSFDSHQDAKPLLVNNRVVLHLLNALQMQQIRTAGGTEVLKLNYSSLDVERIGNVYEGLLDHTARRASQDLIELDSKEQPILSLDQIEAVAAKGETALTDFLIEQTKKSKNQIARLLREMSAENLFAFDAHELSRLRVACQNDDQLYNRALPYFRLIRRDTRGFPIVIRRGSLYVSAGEDRRSTGTHYTPAHLTREVVKHTLEPLVYVGASEGKPREEWQLKSAKEILKLKVCDIACGSGAFLVQANRFLAEKVVECWNTTENAFSARSSETNPVFIQPDGELSIGDFAERAVPSDPKERLVTAKRLVADRCLYGVDRNPVAVEMAKISLWLETLQKNKPFTFLDHSIRSGDSLLGVTDLEQLENFGLATGKGTQIQIAAGIYAELLKDAVAKRLELEAIQSDNVLEIERKESLLKEAEKAAGKVRLIADLLVGFSLETAGKRKKVWSNQGKQAAEEIEAENLEAVAGEEDSLETLVSEAVEYWQKIDLDGDAAYLAENPFAGNPIREIQEQSARLLGKHTPFHWLLEFPEVFSAKTDETAAGESEIQNPKSKIGFDAVVSNPPFMGGKKITGNLGTDYRDFMIEFLAGGQRGNADLVAYFFLRVMSIVKAEGFAGLVATNTIAQGDSREVGLDQIAANEATIYRAVSSRKWEGTAALEVSFVWLKNGGAWQAERILDDKKVNGITPLLTAQTRISGNPFKLKENEDKSYQGSCIRGNGFVLTPNEASALIEKDERNQQVLFPYLNGEDLNSRPDQSPSRWVINFFNYPLERIDEKEWSLLTEDEREQQAKLGRVAPDYSKPVAKDFPDCLKIAEDKVLPARMNITHEGTRKKGVQFFWRYDSLGLNLYEAISNISEVAVVAATSRTLAFGKSTTRLTFSHMTYVFLIKNYGEFASLQSTFHNIWAWNYGSSMKGDLRYALSDCFETFPFPELTDELEQIGAQYHEFRREIMLNRQEGLTQTYNRFHNRQESAPDIERLRQLHTAMDTAVKHAYGWHDLELEHDFHSTKQGTRFTISPEARQEVLDRLLELNFARHRQEEQSGLFNKPKPAAKSKKQIARAAADDETDSQPRANQKTFGFEPEQNEMF